VSQPQDQRRYKILEVLGKGGFGTVYRAQLHGSGGFRKDVALKVLNPEVASSSDIVQRLRDEARMLGLLRHRAIVNVDALLHLDGRWTIVMEFVDGASLRDILASGALPVSVALEIVEEVAAALDVAYTSTGAEGRPLGLLHRDIKPGNIQLTPRGEVKLLDFGVAKADFGDREAHTRSLIFGSINYLAPERLDFEDRHKGDIYALGCVLYEMLLGESQPKASINPRKHRAKVDEARRRVLEKHHDPDLAELVERCLDYEPERRPDARTLERRARAIRRGYPEPWLKDWAEQAVPRAQAHRSTQDDEWSGSMVDESGSLDNQTLAFHADTDDADQDGATSEPVAPPPPPPLDKARGGGPTLATDSAASDAYAAHPGLEQATPAPRAPAPEPVEPPAPPPRKRRRPQPRKRRKSRVGRWILGIALTLIALIVLVPLILVLATGGGLYALLAGTGIWDDAWDETVTDNMAELEVAVSACTPSPERDRVLTVLQSAQQPGSGANVSLFELVNMEQTVEDAVQDNVINGHEANDVEQTWLRISRD